MRWRKSFAASCARAASREPIKMCSPAFARRYASPEPSAPVPPTNAILRAMNGHSVSNPPLNKIWIKHFGAKPLLRFSRTQYGIFKNFQDANLLTFVIRIPQSSGPFHHRRDRRYCRARARQNSRHDRQLFYVRFARPHADSCLRRPPRQHVFAVAKEKTIRRQRTETKSAGDLRIFRKKRTQCRNRAEVGHSFSADSQRGFCRRRHASPDE